MMQSLATFVGHPPLRLVIDAAWGLAQHVVLEHIPFSHLAQFVSQPLQIAVEIAVMATRQRVPDQNPPHAKACDGHS